MKREEVGFLALCLVVTTLTMFGIFFLFQDVSYGYPSVFPEKEIVSTVFFESEQIAAEEIPDSILPPRISSASVLLIPKGQLANPPDIVQAVYLTSWSAGAKSKIDYVIDLARTSQINAVVIDVKDFSGQISYDTDVPEAALYGAETKRISDIGALMKRLHEKNIYVIGRVTVFQDPILARARPDLAVHSKVKLQEEEIKELPVLPQGGPGLSDGGGQGGLVTLEEYEFTKASLWVDQKDLAWIDPAAKEAWEYTVAIARDGLNHGFDEINFDYIRFPSDGDLQDMQFPFWDGVTPRAEVMREFFKYIRESLPGAVISADLFGLSTISVDDLGIGQRIEYAFEYFDYVCPMVYPSHYADYFLGYENPAEYPYEVVKHSLASAARKLEVLRQQQEGFETPKSFGKLRPWLQDFDLGVQYDVSHVQAEIKAVREVLAEEFEGFLLWAPTNIYTKEAVKKENQLLETSNES